MLTTANPLTTSRPITRDERQPDINRPARKRVALVNKALAYAWRRGWADNPTLEPVGLIAAAGKRTGLSDFGRDAFWRDNLDVLTRSLKRDAALTPLGRVLAHGQIVSLLSSRLRLERLWAKNPGIADQPFAAPIVVLGQMRSGTTRVQRLLACDERLAHTRFFESWNPVPTGALDDRRLRAAATLACTRTLNPDFSAIHPTSASAPDEEIGLHSFSLFGSAFEAQWRIPDFTRHCEEMDTRPVYAEFRRLLRTIAWLRGERGDRPWVLKVPQLTQDTAAVLATFPDARLIRLDRDPVDLVASSASLVRNQMTLQSDRVDPHWIGAEWLRKIGLRRHRIEQVLRTAAAPRVDIAFEDMDRDWFAQIQRVYDLLGLTLDRATEARMRRYLSRVGRQRLDRHRYTLAEFGLTPAQVRAAL